MTIHQNDTIKYEKIKNEFILRALHTVLLTEYYYL